MSTCAVFSHGHMSHSTSTVSDSNCGDAITSLCNMASLRDMGRSIMYNESQSAFGLSNLDTTHDHGDDTIMISFGTNGSTFVVPRDHTLAKYLHQLLPSSSEHTTKDIPRIFDMRAPSITRRNRECKSPSTRKCHVQNCNKISVSRGLCRGHGGGRRCHFAGCAKGAQSRSDFCWAHGGNERCEAKGCMRSRKSKRFCVAHLDYEQAPQILPRNIFSHRIRYRTNMYPQEPFGSQVNFWSNARSETNRPNNLPSLRQALQRQY